MTGPRDADPDLLAALQSDEHEGAPFQMRDDDGKLYYEGRILHLEPGCEDFQPLEDFGMPNAGCTTIEYRNRIGEWEIIGG